MPKHPSCDRTFQIVEQIKDLPAAVRQRLRHIPAGKIARTRRNFTLQGDAQQLASYASQLTVLVQRLLQDQTNNQLLVDVSGDLARLALQLEHVKTMFKESARREIVLAQQQGRLWEVAARTGQAAAFFLRCQRREAPRKPPKRKAHLSQIVEGATSIRA